MTDRSRQLTRFPWAWIVLGVLAASGLLYWFWDTLPLGGWLTALFQVLAQPETLTRLVSWLGWAGPLALIVINALQIIIAPLPNYAVFVVAGLLYGPFWGGVYGLAGMLLGGVAAMLLTRRFGRPLAARLVGEDRLERWDQMQATQNVISWSILFLAPVGDVPFFLAGLAHVS
ncbi:MAG: VTT domain-containing protein, partial [Caldilineaceae bacterium]